MPRVDLVHDGGAALLANLLFRPLIIPCRLLAWGAITLPRAESLNRFFAPDLVFSLGIWLVSVGGCRAKTRRLDPLLVRWSFKSRHGSPLAGRLEGRLDTRGGGDWQPATLTRRQDHHDLPAFRHRLGLDLGDGAGILAHAL